MSAGTSTNARPTLASVAVGDAVPAARYRIRRADLIRYAGASGDFNVIHWNERTARAVGLPDVIAHGMLTMATAGRFVSEWCGDPGAVLEYTVRFTNMVVVPDDDAGAELEVGGTLTAVDAAAGTVTVALTAVCDGQKVLGRATAVVRLR